MIFMLSAGPNLIPRFLGIRLFRFAAYPAVPVGHYSLECSWGKGEGGSLA